MAGGRDAGRWDTLERLLAPRREQFAREYWGRRPLVLSAAERAGGFEDLFSPSAADELLSRRGLRAPFLRMARAGNTLADREFTTGGGVGAGIADQVDEDAVRRRFAAGATIVLQGLHRTWTPIANLAGGLAAELGHPVQVNAYITPPANQGFSAHYDVHDVFVLQIHGAKSWRIHEPVWSHPLRDQPWDSRRGEVEAAAREEPVIATELAAGDLLYLPRGYLHSATASGAVSIHLTVGIHTWTRAHLLDAALEQLRRVVAADPESRVSLPCGVDVARPSDIAEDAASVVAALGRAVADLDVPEIAAALQGAARAAQRPAALPVLAQVAAADAIQRDDVLTLRPHLQATLDTIPGTEADPSGDLIVRSRAGRCPVPACAGPAVRRLLDGEVIPVRSLAPQDDRAAVELARRLLVEGVAVAGQPRP